MSAQDCINVIQEAMGRELSDTEALDLLESLTERKALIEKRTTLGEAEAMRRAVAETADEIDRAALIQKRNALLNAQAKLNIVEQIQNNWADRPDLGLESFLVGTNVARSGSRASVAATQKQLSSTYIAGVMDAIERTGHFDLFASGAMDREVARALWQLNQPEPRLKGLPKEAQEIAQAVRAWQERARIDANRAGANIGKLDDYIVQQTHDPYKLASEGVDRWKAFVRERIDFDRTPQARSDEWLQEVYVGLKSGIHLKADSGFSGSGTSNLAKRVSEERVLHFKNADAWYQYNNEFGTGSVREAVIGSLDRMGETTGMLRKLGTNPRRVWDEAVSEIQRGLKGDAEGLERFDTVVRGKLENRFAEIDGTTRIPVNATGARVASNVRAIQSMAKLGGAVLSAVADLPIAASELRYQGSSFLGGMARTIGDLARSIPKGTSRERRQILSSAGVFLDSMRGNVVSRFSADDSLGGRMTRAQRLFFKYNALQWWTDTVRSSASLTMMHHLAQNADASFNELGDLRRVLELYDITSDDWNVMRKNTPVLEDKRAYMTPDGMPDDIADKLRTFITDRASYAVIEPDARTRSILRQGTQPGTVIGELIRFIGQFKAFPVAVLQKSVGRELYGRGYSPSQFGARFGGMRELGNALSSGNGEILGLAHLMLWTTAFGYLAMSAKDLAKGRTPRPPDDPKTWMAAMLQGGALGIYGDFIVGEMNRFGGGAIQTMAGPALGTGEDVIQLFQRMRDGDDAAASAFALARDNTPFMNLFYTRAALDYLFFYQMQESMNPGYIRRLERRVERENRQKFLISPRDAVGL